MSSVLRNMAGIGPNGTLLAVVLMLLGACTSIPVEQRESYRNEIDRDAEETVAALLASEPRFRQALDESAGYFTSRVSSATASTGA